MARKDRVGSKIVFCDNDETEQEGKIVRRKKNGDLIVLCLTGRNRGNSKKVKPDQIVQSSAAPEVKEMIELGESVDSIVESVVENYGIFNDKVTSSWAEVQDIIDHLESEFPNFQVDEKDGEMWGYFQGDAEGIFKYDSSDGYLWSDYTIRELKNLTAKDLK